MRRMEHEKLYDKNNIKIQAVVFIVNSNIGADLFPIKDAFNTKAIVDAIERLDNKLLSF